MATVALDLLIGTTNLGKGRELAALLAPHGFQIRTLQDVASPIDVVEDGDSFAANACKKARELAQHLDCWVLADDSGIEVDALDGAPGIFSARYASEDGGDDAANNAKLVAELSDVPRERRTANYYCHVTVADPKGDIRAESSGICRGLIRTEPAGTNGFGYDPLFEVIELHRTFGELGPRIKAALSHRARAMRAMVPQLAKLAVEGSWD
ncbi:MAG: RdgB/HAM1 family non-canonical purine NTP pyrophosphatase [Planctomycetota bacterium]